MTRVEVWAALPSANLPQCAACLNRFRSLGYRTAVFVDEQCDLVCDLLYVNQAGEFPGYYTAMNVLTQEVVRRFDAEVVVAIGDDMHPHPTIPAGEIGRQFLDRFPDGLGVMQPLGDKWPKTLDEICGSPWMGRRFVLEMNNGKGPWHPGYFHFFGDQELRDVSMKMGALLQRPDLIQYHDHWSRNQPNPNTLGIGASRRRPGRSTTMRRKRPAYMLKAKGMWGPDKALYHSRREEGFPGHEPRA